MVKRFVVFVWVMALVACIGSPTLPYEETHATTQLGFHIQILKEYSDVGGVLTTEHSERADRWWRELMTELSAAGMQGADPEDIQGYVSIALRKPLNDQGEILYGNCSRAGGYYDQINHKLYVPGDYDQDHWRDRPSAQALKHEMLHHWCWITMRHFCTVPGDDNPWTNHHWKAPNGTDIWDFTWH